MASQEHKIINLILKHLPKNRRLFRINAGVGWVGKYIARIKNNTRIVLENPRPLHAAPKGWPDLCGWESVVVTPAMVGKRFARFLAVEVKATGKLSAEQERLKTLIEKMGGIYELERCKK